MAATNGTTPQNTPPAAPQVAKSTRKRYTAVTDNVTAYQADIGDRTFTFNRRPSARLQIKAMRTFSGRDDDTPITPDDITLVSEVLAAMLADPADLDDLMAATDLEPLVELMGDAMETVTARPTTEPQGSSSPPQETTSATGSPASDSNPAISPV